MEKRHVSMTICLAIILTICLLGTIPGFSSKNIIIKADTTETFVGLSGSLTDIDLYNATNTYNYNGDNDIIKDDAKSGYDYFNTNVGTKNSNSIYSGAPQITVLTHGLGGDASHWSNNGMGDFSYDERSLFSRINVELRKNGKND